MEDFEKMNVAPTVEVIRAMARKAQDLAEELDRIATRVERDGTFEQVSEAVHAVTNSVSNFRLDLLVTRPLREYNRRDDGREHDA